MVDPKKDLEQWGPIDAVVLYMSFWYKQTGTGVTKTFGVEWPELVASFKNNRITFWWEKDKMQRNAEIAINRWLIPKTRFKFLKEKYKKSWQEFLSLEQEIKIFLKTDSNNKTQLKYLVKKLYRVTGDFWSVSLVFELANFGAPKFLEQKLKSKIPLDKLPYALQIFLTPLGLSFHQHEEMELLETYIKEKTKNKLVRKIVEHTKKWHWLENSYFKCRDLGTDYFLTRLNSISRVRARSKIKTVKFFGQKNLKAKQKLIRKFRLGKEIMNLVNLLSFSIWWQDDRKGKMWRICSCIDKLATQTAVMHNITKEQILAYNAEEWLNILNTNRRLSLKEIRSRKDLTAVVISPKKYRMLSGNRANKILKPFHKENKIINFDNTIEGTVVSKGKVVKAKVTLVMSPNRNILFEEGNILVAPMTEPEYVPLMRKASAIITDVGGLMSHAAVISRELGIPCVVNTKIATKVLKDGDLVEVDTNKGIVNILKSK